MQQTQQLGLQKVQYL